MSTDAILTGLGLVIVLALGCQLVASWTRLPAIVLLLPAGFIAGAVTNDVHPSTLFGATFQPIVSLGVGFILFGRDLTFDELTRRFEEGATLVTTPADKRGPEARIIDGSPRPLFVISPTGGLRVVTGGDRIEPSDGESVIWLAHPRTPARAAVAD